MVTFLIGFYVVATVDNTTGGGSIFVGNMTYAFSKNTNGTLSNITTLNLVLAKSSMRDRPNPRASDL